MRKTCWKTPIRYWRVIRAWERENDGPAGVKELAGWDFDDLLQSVLLRIPGTLKNTKAIDQPKDIDYQQGRLKGAHARTGEINRSTDDGAFKRKFTFWNHADLPFGVAELEVRDDGFDRNGKNNYQVRLAYQLQDFGADAKTELPDNN